MAYTTSIEDEDVAVCQCCGKRPAAGYIPRYGVYIERFCTRCWVQHRDGDPKVSSGRHNLIKRANP